MLRLRALVLAASVATLPSAALAQQVPARLPKPATPPPPAQFRDLIVHAPAFVFARARLRALHITNATDSPAEGLLLEEHGLRLLARLVPGGGATLSDLRVDDDLWLRLFARRAGDHALLDLSHWSLTPADTTWCTIRRGKVRERYIISS